MTTPSQYERANNLGGAISGAIRGSAEQRSLEEILSKIQQGTAPQNIAGILQRFSPERQQIAMNAINQRNKQRAYQDQGLDPSLADLDPTIQKEIVKNKNTQKNASADSKKHVQDAYNRVKEILDSGYTGWSPTGLTPEGREQRSELDTLGEVFISNLIPLLNPRGTISRERFNYIKSLAPTSWDTDATMKGKLKALSDIFGLEDSRSGSMSSGPKTIEMRDSQGNIYDIPEDMVDKARAGGLK